MSLPLIKIRSYDVLDDSNLTLEQQLELAKILIRNAVDGIFRTCGNSYSNCWTEDWLSHAKTLGAYSGPVIGKIVDLEKQNDQFCDEHPELLDMPDSRHKAER